MTRSCPWRCGFALTEEPIDGRGRRVTRRVLDDTWRRVLEHHRRDGRCARPLRGYRSSWWRRLLRLR